MTTVDEVLALYERWGGERYDEEVAQLDHALQTAALAAAAGATDAVVAAALLHDAGHLLALRGDPPGPHERTGPAYLTPLFPAAVTGPIALHVAAKRYLCAVEPAYAAGLSAGSTRSLARQGGPMSPADAAAFADDPAGADAVALRRWDDAGKVDGLAVPGLAAYESLLRGLACSGS
jgi:[1-hydroxy-2-(trimethylamino)ethyl]phosphonate dioxygenase